MNKKGFTLVELLAVIAIIGIILIISVPQLINNLSSAKQTAYNKLEKLIISAGRNYIVDHDISIPTSVSVSELCDNEYLTCPIENPINKSNMAGYVNVDINNIYTYTSN